MKTGQSLLIFVKPGEEALLRLALKELPPESVDRVLRELDEVRAKEWVKKLKETPIVNNFNPLAFRLSAAAAPPASEGWAKPEFQLKNVMLNHLPWDEKINRKNDLRMWDE